MSRKGLILLALVLLTLPTVMASTLTTTAASTGEYTLTTIVYGPVTVDVHFPNYTVVTVGNATIHFRDYVEIIARVPNGYILYVNDTRYGTVYYAKINTSTTLIFKAVEVPPTYVTVTVNIIGKGNATVLVYDTNPLTPSKKFVVDHSITFTTLNRSMVWIESNQSFVVNGEGVITKIYGIEVYQNLTLNVDFNVQNFKYSPSKYAMIRINIIGNGSLNITIVSHTLPLICYTILTINSSTTLMAPLGSKMSALGDRDFWVKGNVSFDYADNRDFTFVVTGNVTLNVSFINPKYTTTTASSTQTSTSTTAAASSSTTVPTTSSSTTVITIPPHTGPIITTTSSSSGSGYNSAIIYAIIVVVILVALFVYLMVRRRK